VSTAPSLILPDGDVPQRNRATPGLGLRVLVIAHEPFTRRSLRAALAGQEYRVFASATAHRGVEAAAAVRPDLIILELDLPDADGIDVITHLREWSSVPIIALSVSNREARKVAALDTGADDYLTEPFSTGELLARMRVAMRHAARSTNDPVITTGTLRIFLRHRRVVAGGRDVALTRTEYSLLRTLARSAGQVLSHRHLLHDVWGPGYEQDLNLLRVTINKLRRRLELDSTRPQYVRTVPGVGYRLHVSDQTADGRSP